jgi:hypothetical protein
MPSIPDWLGYLDTQTAPLEAADYAFMSGDRISTPLITRTGYRLTLHQRRQVLRRLRQQDRTLVLLLRQHIADDVLDQFALGLLARWWTVTIALNALEKNWVGWSVAHLLSMTSITALCTQQLENANLLYALHVISALTQMQSPVAQFYLFKYWVELVSQHPKLEWLHQQFLQMYQSIHQANITCLSRLTLPYPKLYHAGQVYSIALDKGFTLRLYTADGAILAVPPANADSRMLAQWQACVQLVEDVRLVQQHLLETAMREGARWTIDEFKRLYWQHPLTRSTAQTLIWGVYREDELRATFRITPELTLSSHQDRDYRLPRSAATRIGVVSPAQLSARVARQWRTILFDYAILQPFVQVTNADAASPSRKRHATVQEAPRP